jgi:gliding motility associated protien GldN
MRKVFASFVAVVLFSACFINADAQRTSRGGRGRTTRTDTTAVNQQQQVQQNNNQPTNLAAGYGNAKIVMAPVTGGFNDTLKPSLRPDNVFGWDTTKKDREPLPYEFLRKDDQLYRERVWREIDIREKVNQPFRYKAQDDNGDLRFISILVKAIRDSAVVAFSADNDDDRFTKPLTIDEVNKILNGGSQCDTQAVYNLLDPTKIDSFVITCNVLNPDDVVKFRIKEDWVFDRESSRMFVRILGIAPCKTFYSIDKKTERGASPMFWIYYPDLRPVLARIEAYNPKTMGMGRMTWEELFESRMFSSYILKSTLDNPSGKPIRQYMRDPILALLEGENIKEKIFNYEQDLWSY